MELAPVKRLSIDSIVMERNYNSIRMCLVRKLLFGSIVISRSISSVWLIFQKIPYCWHFLQLSCRVSSTHGIPMVWNFCFHYYPFSKEAPSSSAEFGIRNFREICRNFPALEVIPSIYPLSIPPSDHGTTSDDRTFVGYFSTAIVFVPDMRALVFF